MTNPNQIQSLVLQILRLAKVPYIDPCTGLLVGDCNDTCGTGGSGGPTTNTVSFNPTTNEITTVVNGVSSTTVLNLDSGDVVTTSSITVDGTPFAAGTSLQTIVNAIAAKTHVPAVLTNTNAAFSWNTATQVGNIPLSSSLVDNGDGTATFTKGDGSAPVTINLGISTADAITTTNPIIIDGTTYPTGTSVEDILIDLQNSINFNISTGPDGVVTNATQTVTINPGDNIHFYSSNSTIDFDVTLGSAIVDGKVVNLFTTAPITVQGVTYAAGTSVFTILAALTSGSTPTVSDTGTIDLTLSGNDISGIIVGSDTATNGQVPQSDGAGGLVWVTPSAGHIAVTTADSPSITLSGYGVDNQTLEASVKISAAAGNDLSTNADGLYLDVAANETVTSLVNTVVGHQIGVYTNEAGGVATINETVTTLAAAPDGFEYTNEDGTVSTVTYLFDNTTPSAPVLLVQVDGTTQASIPLNSYDVNITTTGGFAFNPLTDVITITETDGETHTIDLTPLRTTVTSIDSSVGIVQSVNPDGSTNYDLGVKSHSNETQVISYTGTELPVITGVNIGDTVTTNFTNGVAHYTFDGTNWVLNFFVPAGFAIDTLCDTTGTPVIVFADENGNLSYKNPDNTPYTGDVSLLENCCCDVPHPPVVTNDSGSINFTQSGTDNQTITAILTGADTATLDQFPASDGAGNIVWTSPLVTAARHDLRLVGTNLERGSDSATTTNGAEFIHNSYSHLNGFSDNWIGALGSSEPVQTISNTKDIFNRIVTIGGGDLKVNEVKVGRGQGDVITNTVVGRLALHNNTTGFYNDAKGYYSMHSNTTGSYNTANGAFSLYANLDGTLNSAFGYNSMGNSTGSYSTSFGAETLVNNVNVYNNAFGHNSLKQNTSGYQNCAYGAGSMLSNTDGYRNNAIGHYAMSNNINGSLNCALGYYSMSDGMSGTENTAIGSYSLRQTNGAYNVGIGTLSGESNTGNSNVFIGHGSGKNSINTDGSVFIGYNAGQNEISSNKLFICNSNTSNPLIGGDFSTQELKIGGVQQFSVQYPITGAGVANGSMFYGTDGALYFKGGSGTVTQIAPN